MLGSANFLYHFSEISIEFDQVIWSTIIVSTIIFHRHDLWAGQMSLENGFSLFFRLFSSLSLFFYFSHIFTISLLFFINSFPDTFFAFEWFSIFQLSSMGNFWTKSFITVTCYDKMFRPSRSKVSRYQNKRWRECFKSKMYSPLKWNEWAKYHTLRP